MLLLTCSKLLTRLFLIKGWIYKKKPKKTLQEGRKFWISLKGGGDFHFWGKNGKFHPKPKRSGYSPGIPFPLSPLPNTCTSERVHFQGSDCWLAAGLGAPSYEDGIEFSLLKIYKYLFTK